MAADLSATRVVVEPDKQTLADSVATRFVGKLAQLTQAQPVVHVSLTGGSMGAASCSRQRVSRVHARSVSPGV